MAASLKVPEAASSGEEPASLVDETLYPAIDAAFTLVIPSYQMVLSRLEATDTRLTALLTLSFQLTLGLPAFAKAVRPALRFSSALFIVALGLFVIIALLGVVARSLSAVALPNPRKIYRSSLHLKEATFKREILYFAGEAFDANASLVRRKGNAAAAMTGLLFLEVLCLVAWMVR